MESINAVSSLSVSYSQILKVSHFGGRLPIVVNDPIGINARFKHIIGVPTILERNVSYFQLKRLDILIEQISRLRDRRMDVDVESIDNLQLQGLIDNLSADLRDRLNTPVNYNHGIYSPGSILNMTA
ncbi:MAG: hypothetical protein FWC36_08615 [Spirochaetes bacterium]|nr:hypothetical protein [Spirochaetota bacterium]